MRETHLACPNCGYDLHGIPQVRCPECGFGFDHAALRSLADSADWVRLAAARAVIVRASIAAALWMPLVVAKIGGSGFVLFVVTAAAYLSAYVITLVVTDAYKGPESLPGLITLFVTLGVALVLVLSTASVVVLVVGLVLLVHGWYVRLFKWVALAPSSNVRSTDVRRSVARHSIGATCLLIAASLLLLVMWVA